MLMSINTIKDFTIKYTDVDTERMSSTEIQDNERSKGQRIAYLEYNHEKFGSNQPLVIQFPWIRIVNYGVPKMDEKFFKNDSERAFIKIPLDDNIPESAELIKMLIKLDELFSSKKFCEHLFGKKYEKYIKGYVPIYRKPVLNEDEDNDDISKKKLSKSTIPKYPYMKVKIDTDYTTGEVKTKLYRSELIDNKRIRTELQEIKTIDDFAREVCWNSNIRIIIRFVKIWAQPLTKKDPIWGATFKIMKAEVEPPTKSNSLYKDYMNSDAFLDSDEETNNLPNVPIPVPVPTKKVKSDNNDSDEKPKSPKKVAQVESDDSDEKPKSPKKVAQVESDDSDDSEEEKPKTVKKVAQVESDDSDDSEEEKPKTVKKVAQVESDNDDSEEEKPKPVKKVAQVESDDSNEDSNEEKPPPPIKKSVAKTTGRGSKAKN
jgi:hypothetical protein